MFYKDTVGKEYCLQLYKPTRLKVKIKKSEENKGSKSFTLSIANRPTICHKNLLRKSSEILCIVSDNGSESPVIFRCLVTSHPISGCILFLSILLLEHYTHY